MMRFLTPVALASVIVGAVAVHPGAAAAQDQRDEWFYLPGSFNWQFLGTYPSAARLFNAFDYGHAVLYERLYTKRGHAEPELEKEYRFLTTDLLVKPPRFAVVEEVVSPAYAKVAWRAKQMFDWAHLLHRQIYDVYSDERIPMARKDSLIERLTDYYLLRKKYAFAPLPKSMDLMEGQYFSRTFRQAYPKFNGLIWAYHWLQVGLYEPLVQGRTPADRKAGVDAAVARFWSMLQDPPSRMPAIMPMTAAVAPRFSERHPRAAAIFDNLHMMHDIISDILTADTVPHEKKRQVIYAQLDKLQDSTRDVMSWDEWRHMPDMMGGLAVMGGPPSRLIANPPTPQAAGMAGMQHGQEGHERHGMPGGMADSTGMGHHGAAPGAVGVQGMKHMQQMMELHRRMMADPVIRQRVMSDPEMRRLMTEVMDSSRARNRPPTKRPTPEPTPPAPAPGDSMPHHHEHSLGPALMDAPATQPNRGDAALGRTP